MKPTQRGGRKVRIAEDALSLFMEITAKISAGQLEALKDKPDAYNLTSDSYFSDTSRRRQDHYLSDWSMLWPLS